MRKRITSDLNSVTFPVGDHLSRWLLIWDWMETWFSIAFYALGSLVESYLFLILPACSVLKVVIIYVYGEYVVKFSLMCYGTLFMLHYNLLVVMIWFHDLQNAQLIVGGFLHLFHCVLTKNAVSLQLENNKILIWHISWYQMAKTMLDFLFEVLASFLCNIDKGEGVTLNVNWIWNRISEILQLALDQVNCLNCFCRPLVGPL